MSVGSLLRSARKSAGIRVEDVARKLSMTESAWYKIENGKRFLPVDLMKSACDALNIPYQVMLEEAGLPFAHGFALPVDDDMFVDKYIYAFWTSVPLDNVLSGKIRIDDIINVQDFIRGYSDFTSYMNRLETSDVSNLVQLPWFSSSTVMMRPYNSDGFVDLAFVGTKADYDMSLMLRYYASKSWSFRDISGTVAVVMDKLRYLRRSIWGCLDSVDDDDEIDDSDDDHIVITGDRAVALFNCIMEQKLMEQMELARKFGVNHVVLDHRPGRMSG